MYVNLQIYAIYSIIMCFNRLKTDIDVKLIQ